MTDFFSEFDSTSPNETSGEDPVAAFLAREKEELDKIENDNFGNFAATNIETTFGDDFSQPQNEVTANNDDFGSEVGAQSTSSMYSAISQADKFSQEPEKIKKWRDEQRDRLAKKDAEEDQKKKEWKDLAKKEIDDWYAKRKEQLEKTHASNKVNNKTLEAELVSPQSGGNGPEWDRVSKLCDFNPKGNKNTKDVSRMRSILLQLKQQPLVKNAH